MNPNENIAYAHIDLELKKALDKWPENTTDPYHAASITAEEILESAELLLKIGLGILRTGHDVTYSDKSMDMLKNELAQTGAMCVRFLMFFDMLKPERRYEQ